MNLKALHTLSYGVYLCTSWDEGRPVGCVANCAVQITSDPATVAVSINKKNFTHACIFATGFFAIAVLAEDQIGRRDRSAEDCLFRDVCTMGLGSGHR